MQKQTTHSLTDHDTNRKCAVRELVRLLARITAQQIIEEQYAAISPLLSLDNAKRNLK
jgi:hypothetical protein